MTTAEAWTAFSVRMGEIEDLQGAIGLLAWDEQTFCSAKGREARAMHSATLATIEHQRVIDPAYGEAIDTLASDGASLTDAQRAMVRVAKHDRDRSVRVPADLVRGLSEQASRTNVAWEQAREERSFARFVPDLSRLLRLKIEQADCLADGSDRYDALLDAYEPGMTVAKIDPLLAGLRSELVAFVDEITALPPPDRAVLAGPYDRDRQRELTLLVLADFGFDFEAGRQDISIHPFCGGPGPTDVRLTTHYYDSLEPGALFSSMHECGHGLYEQGMPASQARTTIAHAPSLGLHESQSRFWENVIGRSHAFWRRYLPIAREYFPQHLNGVELDAFVRAVNAVQRSLIRIDADEVTYNLHIIVRYELERGLLDETIAPAALAEAWNDAYQRIVGVTAPDDVRGVLQDVHWSWGELGYFPTYTLGNLYSAAILETMRTDLDVEQLVEHGDFAPILRWLRERIHQHGHLYPADELMRRVTGQPLSHEPFMRYLRDKYRRLYQV